MRRLTHHGSLFSFILFLRPKLYYFYPILHNTIHAHTNYPISFSHGARVAAFIHIFIFFPEYCPNNSKDKMCREDILREAVCTWSWSTGDISIVWCSMARPWRCRSSHNARRHLALESSHPSLVVMAATHCHIS
jgi:hypothetical protein